MFRMSSRDGNKLLSKYGWPGIDEHQNKLLIALCRKLESIKAARSIKFLHWKRARFAQGCTAGCSIHQRLHRFTCDFLRALYLAIPDMSLLEVLPTRITRPPETGWRVWSHFWRGWSSTSTCSHPSSCQGCQGVNHFPLAFFLYLQILLWRWTLNSQPLAQSLCTINASRLLLLKIVSRKCTGCLYEGFWSNKCGLGITSQSNQFFMRHPSNQAGLWTLTLLWCQDKNQLPPLRKSLVQFIPACHGYQQYSI